MHRIGRSILITKLQVFNLIHNKYRARSLWRIASHAVQVAILGTGNVFRPVFFVINYMYMGVVIDLTIKLSGPFKEALNICIGKENE